MKTRIFPAIKKQNDMLAVKRKSKEKLVENFGGDQFTYLLFDNRN